jgi:membrane fusion protein (multidrug efflux system)
VSLDEPKKSRKTGVIAGATAALVLAFAAWVLAFHSDWLRPQVKAETEEDIATEVPVSVGTISRVTLHRYIDAYGTVVPDGAHDGKPPASARLAAPVSGILAKLTCSEGQRVELGAPLFQLDARAAAAEEQKASAASTSSKATLARLKLAVDFAEREYDRAKRLKEEGISSDKDLAEADLKFKSAKEDLSEANAKAAEAGQAVQTAHVLRSLTTVRAPLSGTVVRIHLSPGEFVDAASVLADLIDLDRLVVAAMIPATELRFLKIGQPVELDSAPKQDGAAEPDEDKPRADGGADPAHDGGAEPSPDGGTAEAEAEGPPYHGAVTFIGFEVDAKTGTVLVRSSIPKGAPLLPGQYLRLRIVVEERADCLAVPEASVVTVPDLGTVIAIINGDEAKQQPVVVGLREGGLVEVKGDGLKEGMTVATAGAYGLPRQTKVRATKE